MNVAPLINRHVIVRPISESNAKPSCSVCNQRLTRVNSHCTTDLRHCSKDTYRSLRLVVPLADIDEVAGDGGGGGHGGGDEVGAAAFALAAFEIAVARAGAALLRLQLVGVH